MDICLRKQLIVTCSVSCIMLWNYAEKRFLMAYNLGPSSEAAPNVAFHPSGFHILACVGDKLLLLNVLSNRINEYQSIPFKNCKEVRFSHGGHLFAVGKDCYSYIHDFYTLDCPPNQ